MNMCKNVIRHACVLTGLLLVSLAAPTGARIAPPSGSAGAFAAKQAGVDGAATKKNPLFKLAQPWPSADERRLRKKEAEAHPLFSGTDPITVTIAAEFRIINKDHDPKSSKRYPGELKHTRADGRVDTIPVKLSARGHVRRLAQTCDYVPLRVEFSKESLKETVFDGQSTLKLVVQCRDGGEYDQYILREHLAYRIFNLLTSRSLRTRLARVTYVDSTTGKVMGTRYAMFLEHDSDVARRMEGRSVELQRVQFKDVDADTLETMMVFAYMIGNTDFSIYALHNVVLVQTPDLVLHTVPYDFDISGLVHPPYAIPMKSLPIKTVDERLYRGPCRTMEQMEPVLANVSAKTAAVMDLLSSISGFNRGVRQETRTFLEGFFSSIGNQGTVKRVFVEKCSKAPAM